MKISLQDVNFENQTFKLHVLYVLNMHIKFHSIQVLFTARLINLFFIYTILDHINLKFKHLIDNITIEF